MAQLDTYLVEKLREILERLHEKGKFNKFSDQVPSHEEQVAFKRSPSLFPFAPSEILSPSGSDAKRIESSVVQFDEDDASDPFDYETYSSPPPTRDFSTGYVTFNSSLSSDNYSDSSIPYGVKVNCTSTAENTSHYLNQESLEEFGKEENSVAASDLTRSLHEFIHILKMSLKSGTAPFYTNSEGVLHQKGGQHSQINFGMTHEFPDSAGGNRGSAATDPFSGIEVASKTNMEFNLTLDDIIDLNNLLEGDDYSSGIPTKHVFIIATYFIIACVSIIGNLLVIQLVIRSRRFHTLTHALLANLAASDLVLATINIPFSAARVIMTEWHFGPVMCRTVPFLQVTSVYATSFTMAVIAMDRYQVIMNPLGKRLKCSQGVLLVLAIWIISAVLSLPYALNHQVVKILTVRVVKRCQAEYGSPRARQLLTVATFLAQYLLPLVFTTVSYISIMKRLWYRSSGLGSTTPRQVAAQSRAKLKTIKMLILTVIFFAVTWLPIHLYHLFTQFSHIRPNSTAILICHMIAMSSSMYNPFIFCGLNEHFRREAVKWLRCFRTRRSPVVHPGTEVNGMLARMDQQGQRQNMSSTIIHTTLSYRRSPQHPQRYTSPRSGNRRGFIAAPPPTAAAVYMTPRPGSSSNLLAERVIGSSPTISRLITSRDSSSRNESGASTSGGAAVAVGYQPELLFLVRDRMLSPTDDFDVEAMDSVEDDMNAEDFLDSLGDEISLSAEYHRGNTPGVKSVHQYAKDSIDIDDNHDEDVDDEVAKVESNNSTRRSSSFDQKINEEKDETEMES